MRLIVIGRPSQGLNDVWRICSFALDLTASLPCNGEGKDLSGSGTSRPAIAWHLLYEPNVTLSMLHALLVGCINPMGKGSGYLHEYLKDSGSLRPQAAQQIQLFFSPNILDNWTPHFTLLNPYIGTDPASMASRLGRVSEAYSTLTIQSLCLLVQERNDANWFIYREVSR